MRVKFKLRRTLENNYPEIRNNLSNRSKSLVPKNFEVESKNFLTVLASFGSTTASRKFVNSFIDITAIENTNDFGINRLKQRLIQLNSIFPKIWIVMMLSIIIAFIFWPNDI